ncbi:MAG: hypothetical protein ABIK23_03980 [candidate division WOR-3 bacterium]
MRRNIFVLAMVFAGLGLLVSCSRENALEIVSVNEGKPINSDLTDFGIFKDATDPEAEPEYVSITPDDVVPIELRYTEIGLGLPTWRPYVARITKATITFTKVLGEVPEVLPKVESRVNISVMSDPEGKKATKGYITLIPAIWKEEVFGGGAGDPDELGIEATLKAKIRLEGVDEASGKSILAETEVLVNIGNFWDEPSRIGD